MVEGGGDGLEEGFDFVEGGGVEGVVVDLFGDDFGHGAVGEGYYNLVKGGERDKEKEGRLLMSDVIN